MVEAIGIAASGEYRDERLHILKSLERIEKKLDEEIKKLETAMTDLGKFRGELRESHGRIKKLISDKEKLSQRLLRVEIKAGSIAAFAGVMTAGAVETLRFFLKNR